MIVYRKTQIAAEYTYRLRSSNAQLGIFWVHAGDLHRVRESYRRIAAELGVPGLDDSKTPFLGIVQKWLSAKAFSPWLLILDNLDDISILEQPLDDTMTTGKLGSQAAKKFIDFLPQSDTGKILITSRDREASRVLLTRIGSQSGACLISIPTMDEADSVALVKAKLPNLSSSQDEEVCGFVRDLEYLPLAISQALAYILVEPSLRSIAKYRQTFHQSESSKISLLQQSFEDIRQDKRPIYAVLFTWNLSFQHIKSRHPSSAELLEAISFYSHHHIPIQLLEALINDEERLDDVILPLLQYHLVSLDSSSKLYGLHHFVHLATRLSLRKTDAYTDSSRKALTALVSSLPHPRSEFRNIFVTIAPHAAEMLVCEFKQPDEQLLLSSVSMFMARHWGDASSFAKAEGAAIRAMEIRSVLLGQSDSRTVDARFVQAQNLVHLGKSAEAESIIRDLISILEASGREGRESSPADLEITLCNCYDVLGQALINNGNYAESERWFRKALQLYGDGDDHRIPDKQTGRHNLAVLLIQQGKFDEAEDLISRLALPITIKAFGPGSVEEHEFKVLLAEIDSQKHRLEAANTLLIDAQKVLVRRFGRDHYKTLRVAYYLLLVSYKQKRYEEALAGTAELLDMAGGLFDATHESVLRIRSLQGTVLNSLQQPTEGLRVHEEVWALRKQSLGIKHPDTILSMHQLAVSKAMLGELEASIILLENALGCAQEVLPLGHDRTLMIMHDRAGILYRLKQFKEATQQQHACVELLTRSRTYRNNINYEVTFLLAEILYADEQFEEALEYYRDTLETFHVIGADEDDIAMTKARIARTSEKLGKHGEAERLLQETVDELTIHFDSEHVFTLQYTEQLADFLSRQSRFTEAEAKYTTLLETHTKKFGPDDHRKLVVSDKLGQTLRSLGKLQDAEARHRDDLSRRKQALPNDQLSIFLTMNNLSVVLYDLKRFDEAVELTQTVIEGRSSLLGADHENTRHAQLNLMEYTGAQSNWTCSDGHFSSVLEGRTREYGAAHETTLETWTRALDVWAKYDRAEKIIETKDHVIHQYVSVLGEEHCLTKKAIANIADSLAKAGKSDEAEILYDRVYKPWQESRDEHSPKTMFVFKFAALLKASKKYGKMELFARELLEESINFNGKSSPGARCATVVLATALQEQFRYQEVIPILEERLQQSEKSDGIRSDGFCYTLRGFGNNVEQASVLDPSVEKLLLRCRDNLLATDLTQSSAENAVIQIARALASKSHPAAVDTYRAFMNIKKTYQNPQTEWELDVRGLYASALYNTGQLKEAVSEAKKVLHQKQTLLGPDHLSSLAAMSDLAMITLESGAIYDAERIALDAFRKRRDVLGEFHSLTLLTQSILGLIQMHCGRYKLSEETLRSTISKQRSTRNPGQFSIINTRNRLAQTLLVQGRATEAVTVLKQPFPDGPTIPDSNHRWSMNRAALLAQADHQLGKYAEAKEAAEAVFQQRSRVLGPKHPHTLSSMYDVATIYRSLRELDEASRLALTALKTTETYYGSFHYYTLDLVTLLGLLYSDMAFPYLAELRLRQALFGWNQVLMPGHPVLERAEREYVLFLLRQRDVGRQRGLSRR